MEQVHSLTAFDVLKCGRYLYKILYNKLYPDTQWDWHKKTTWGGARGVNAMWEMWGSPSRTKFPVTSIGVIARNELLMGVSGSVVQLRGESW